MAEHQPRLTPQTILVLDAIINGTAEELTGADLIRVTGLQTGTLYPILSRLERAKWLSARWENGDPVRLGRPRRRYYRVTGLGVREARKQARDIEKAVGRLAWA